MVSFKRTYSLVEQSSKKSTSNKGTSSLRGCEEEVASSGILERRRENEASTIDEESTLGRNSKEYSSNKKDEVCLKVSQEEDDHKVTKLSYKQLSKLRTKLI